MVEWFKLPDGKHGFRGIVGGFPRQIIDDDPVRLKRTFEHMKRDRGPMQDSRG